VAVLLAGLGSGVLEDAEAESQYPCPGKKKLWVKPIQMVTLDPSVSGVVILHLIGAVLVGAAHVTSGGTDPHAAPMPVTQ
jgi:hypothetical protein